MTATTNPSGLKNTGVPLTEARIAAIESPSSGSKTVWDSKLTGFGVRCFPSGNMSFIYYYRPPGSAHKRRIKIGSVSNMRLGEARQLAQQYAGELANGNDPGTKRARDAREGANIVTHAVASYEAYLRSRGVVKEREVISLLRRELGKPFGQQQLEQLDRHTIAQRIGNLEARGLPGAAANLKANASSFFNWAVNQGLMFANPLAGWRRERPTRAQRINRKGKALSDDEIKRVLTAAHEIRPPYGDFVQILLLTGQRRTETAHMAWDQIDFDAGTWTIPAGNAKNGREHIVPLPQCAIDLISRQKTLGSNDYVFAGRTKGSAISGWSKRQAALIAESGVTFTLHDLRRTYRSGLTRLGIDADLAEMMINHQRAELLQIYDREQRLDDRKAAAEKWAEHISSIVRAPGEHNVVPLHTPSHS
jgi:integrase